MSQNLTQSQFEIYLIDKDNRLKLIAWETCTPWGYTAGSIKTSNGRTRYNVVSTREPKNLTISRAANADDDAIINDWLENFCPDEPVIQGANTSGAILMIVPLKGCIVAEPYNRTCKALNVQPIDSSFWNADKMNTNDMSRTEIQLAPSGFKLS